MSQQRSSPSSPDDRRDPARAQHVDIPHRHQCESLTYLDIFHLCHIKFILLISTSGY